MKRVRFDDVGLADKLGWSEARLMKQLAHAHPKSQDDTDRLLRDANDEHSETQQSSLMTVALAHMEIVREGS